MVKTSQVAGPHAQTAPHRPHWTREDVAVAANVRLAVFHCGRTERDAPVLVLVHGLGHWSEAAWSALAGALSNDYRIIAVDLPGFGASAKPDVRYDLAFFTATLAALVDHLALQRFALAGHSLGGLIAASYAAEYPELVDTLALIDPAGFQRSLRLRFNSAASGPAAWLFGLHPSRRLVRHTLLRATFDPAVLDEATFEHAFALACDPAYVRAFARVYAAAGADLRDLRGLHARLARYRGAVLLVWGRHDRYVPIGALAHAQRVYPGAEVLILERSAHMPNVEEPLPIAARLRRPAPTP